MSLLSGKHKVMKYLIVLMLLIVASCKSQFEETSGIPYWFLEADAPSGIEISGTGTGLSKEDATSNALINASSKIRVIVNGIIRSETQVINGNTAEQLQVVTGNEVERLSLSGYQTTHIAFDKKTKLFYVQIKINKLKIYLEKNREYEDALLELEEMMKSAEEGNLIKKLSMAKQISQKAEALKKDVLVLSLLNSDFSINTQFIKLNKYISYNQTLINSVGIKLEGGGEVAFAINSALSNLKLKQKGENTIIISFKKEETKFGELYGSFFAKTKLDIEMRDKSGNLLKSQTINYGGTSVISVDEAYKNSLKSLTNDFINSLNDIL
jgi:hypothetical protein